MPSHRHQLDSSPPRPGPRYQTLASAGVLVELTKANSYNHAVGLPAGLAGNRVAAATGAARLAACVRLDES